MQDRKTKTGSYDYGTLLILAAFIVAVPRWAGVFIASDTATIPTSVSDVLHYVNLVAGIGMGFIEVLGAAYLLDAWGKLNPKKTWNAKHYDHRWKVLTVFVSGLFVLMPFILTPYIVARMTGTNVADALGNTWIKYLWGAAVVMSPIFVIGGVAVAREGLVGVSKQAAIPQRPDEKPRRETPTSNDEITTIKVTDWRQVPDDLQRRFRVMTTGEIRKTFGNLDERKIRDWRRYSREVVAEIGENGHVAIDANGRA